MSKVTQYAGTATALLLLLAMPYYLDAFWLQVGAFVMAAIIGAIGLTVLVGSAGQLSLAHAFFLAVGAYGYAFLAGEPGAGSAGTPLSGPGLPTTVAALLAVALAGAAGLAFSPVAGRLHGLYLGVASLGLVFLGQHVLFNARPVTGGFNGRPIPELSVLGFELTGDEPELVLLGVPFGARERLWYVALLCAVAAYVVAGRIVRGRPGRALRLMRQNPIAAASMGVPLRRYRAGAFVFSAMYAGVAGILIALTARRVVPDHFGLVLSVEYLAMVVIGGLGSVRGAAIGAAFITGTPLVLSHYGDAIGVFARPGEDGIDAATAVRLLYGAAIVAFVIGSAQKGRPHAITNTMDRARRALPGVSRRRLQRQGR
ncbi:amino acid/amide ABC transporter membrane protein 2 (HAAT family) [Actinomadura pelletieri DSM 43383]|uniref:Amino acid/amide ABC transporter membrane protein 2 (HAAT family) n=1 Tax=Actinomadura pelletieri DSM 43383 TaxID=1120940 RepID=A0A495QT43_9ACTN|nr:branched-chain amino acid ABC transporter permease [Actinomadura pelletieri]RKS76670.1 amino acid/amide ABC transporter membrane protein 2 (HAAT family) [Actinomadura pelletieri DSM 43383]